MVTMKVLFCLIVFISSACVAQVKEVSITIDDVPNVALYHADGFNSELLEHITSLKIPVAIFINEKHVFGNEFVRENTAGLKRWLINKNVTAGNHSYSHINYADTTLEAFQRDVLKGEEIISKILKRRPSYFRFPFNSLGNDSVAHKQIRQFLTQHDYIHTPFTIESEDWAYNTLYEDALNKNDTETATAIGKQYITQTLRLFEHFEKLSKELYGRNIKHIYLCHDNKLNTDFIQELVNKLRQRGYSFITLEAALQDKVYLSPEYYSGRYGFSWMYRWEKNNDKRKVMMRSEPVDESFRSAYENFVNRR